MSKRNPTQRASILKATAELVTDALGVRLQDVFETELSEKRQKDLGAGSIELQRFLAAIEAHFKLELSEEIVVYVMKVDEALRHLDDPSLLNAKLAVGASRFAPRFINVNNLRAK